MRQVRYNVAASLDGYIADADGGFDWIPNDPSVDFAGIFARVDTVLLGRQSYELTRTMPEQAWPAGAREDAAAVVAALRAEPGTGEIWLFGGGVLFGDLLAAGQVDAVEVTVVPVLLGSGVPLLPPGGPAATLSLVRSHVYPTGMVGLVYAVVRTTG